MPPPHRLDMLCLNNKDPRSAELVVSEDGGLECRPLRRHLLPHHPGVRFDAGMFK